VLDGNQRNSQSEKKKGASRAWCRGALGKNGGLQETKFLGGHSPTITYGTGGTPITIREKRQDVAGENQKTALHVATTETRAVVQCRIKSHGEGGGEPSSGGGVVEGRETR